MISTLLSVFVGAVVTWFAAWYYYRKAGRELRQEAAELRRLTTILIGGMEKAGWIKVSRDEAGNITEMTIQGSGDFAVPKMRIKGEATVTD